MSGRWRGRRYEVMARREGRWVIDCLAHSEADATERAEALFADATTQAVRVVRGRFSHDGQSFETRIFERSRDAAKKPIRLASMGGAEAWCETADDLYGPASRQAIAAGLRTFLDRFQITPTELLHHHRHIRQLEREDGLLPSAIGRIAGAQAQARGVDAGERFRAIEAFIKSATNRARDALAAAQMPRLGEIGLAALAEAAAQRSKEPFEQGFLLRHAAARALEDVGNYPGKLDLVLGWATPSLPPHLAQIIDELVAGVLGAVSAIKDVLGSQPHLGAALAMLADLAAGRAGDKAAGAAPPSLAALIRLLGEAPMPETRLTVLGRLQRELMSDVALSRDDVHGQRRLFEGIADKLIDEGGLFAGGAPMVDALARRSRKLGVVGGIEDVRFAAEKACARVERLLDLEQEMRAERQKRALATYLVHVLERAKEDEEEELLALAPRIAAARFPEAVKEAVLARLPQRA